MPEIDSLTSMKHMRYLHVTSFIWMYLVVQYIFWRIYLLTSHIVSCGESLILLLQPEMYV